MMTNPKWLILGIPVLLVVIQFVGPQKTNPSVTPAGRIEDHLDVSPEVGDILKRACQNCHSHGTQWPWYSRVAPISWFVIDNVNFGRRKLNLSKWDQYDESEVAHLVEEMCELVQAGEMPLVPYTWLHEESLLHEKDVKVLCEWTHTELNRLGRARE
jgi:hypothetical protein